MIIDKEKTNCCGCYACVNICPQHCINMVADSEGFLYPEVDSNRCIQCGACESVCPVNNNVNSDEKDTNTEPRLSAYAAYNRSEEIRLQSSSGGVFYLLAQTILASGGIVYGTAMSEDCRHVKHIAVSKAEDLVKLQGSKYLQSEVGSAYSDVKNQLVAGKSVLFTGTPCQIEGLKSFLGKEYDNLFCMDIICHGVPSQKVWDKYLTAIENKLGSSAKAVSFRNKRHGWRMYSLSVEFFDGSRYLKIIKDDLFGQAFLQNICLRPYCHTCGFKKINRISDITVADCWKNQSGLSDDDKGMSLVLIHTEKGQQLIRLIKEQMVFAEMNPQMAIKGNTPLYSSANPHPKREAFFAELDSVPVDKLIKKYVDTKKSLKWRLRAFIKWIGFHKYRL